MVATTPLRLYRFHTVIRLRQHLPINPDSIPSLFVWKTFSSIRHCCRSASTHTRTLFFHIHINFLLAKQFHAVSVPTLASRSGLVTFSGGELQGDDGSDFSSGDLRHGCECVDLSPGYKDLPEDLMKKVMILSCRSGKKSECSVYLIGTAHVSKESCRDVKAVISFLEPEAVFLELCSRRKSMLFPPKSQVPTIGETLLAWRKKQNILGVVYSRFLRKIASQLGVLPGYEFRVAFEEAKNYGGKVILGDRPVHITLQRTWAKMPFKHKVTLIFSLLLQGTFMPSSKDLKEMLKEMEDEDGVIDLIEHMGKAFPTLMETLVHERDQYMSAKLLSAAREHGRVVAVVGRGHLQGIKNNWEKTVEMHQLLEIPPRKPLVVTCLKYLGIAVASAFIFSKLRV